MRRILLACAIMLLGGCAEPHSGMDLVAFNTIAPGVPLPGLDTPVSELRARRQALMHALPQAVVDIAANVLAKEMEQPAWIQDPDFFYLTGRVQGTNAVLRLDAPARKVTLFTGSPPRAFGGEASLLAWPDADSLMAMTGVDDVRPMSEYAPTESGATPSDNTVRTALDSLRWTKSPSEVAQLRVNAEVSASALKKGMRAVGHGVMQRRAEAAVVAGCIEAGANGPSFWPWMMAGPNAHLSRLVNSFHVYDNLNRPMLSGELLRADVGCMAGGYGGDVGRTVPVSGSFTESQAFIWDHFVSAYRAGIAVMAAGVSIDSVAAASTRTLEEALAAEPDAALKTILQDMIDKVAWHVHGIGIESAEPVFPVLQSGTVIDFEPMLSLGDDAYYLEDMILITESGAEILTLGIPTTAHEIEDFMGR